MTKAPKDIAASVRARLLQLAKTRGEDFQLLLTRYANERLLYRLSKSRHASGFVLKGAALFMLWTEKPHRATRDVDLLGFGDPSPDRIRGVLRDVIETKVDDDGLVFDASSLESGAIREEQEYGGIRAVLIARLAAAKIRLQIDVGFGDVITPQAIDVDYPALLEFPAPHLRAYPRETVVAEKLEALVHLGLANSRMKDFYDLMVLSRSFVFEGDLLVRAIRATFGRRKTELPTNLPIGLTAAFAEDPTKRSQWTAFVRKTGAQDAGDLQTVVAQIIEFAGPALLAAASGTGYAKRWSPAGAWK
jgi:predicted nucleotidyltransferase component of viral defense system